MSLIDKIKARSTVKATALVSESAHFKGDKILTSTPIPALNIALSGTLDGGIGDGLLQICGPSKHFKSLFAFILAKAFMDKYPESIVIFYDSEFGTPISYFTSLDIDTERVIHTPITDVEQLKFDIASQLNGKSEEEKIFILVDSIGMLASKKEYEDASDGKSTTDMTRAKSFKSLFRIITPFLTTKKTPLVVVNHTYKTQEIYSKDVVGGGTGGYYAADNIWIIGRQQEKKQGESLEGHKFIINIEKSRYVREKSKIPITVLFDGGISKWSGLLDIALESGHVIKPKNGWYQKVDMDETGEIFDKNYRVADTNNKDFWDSILKSKSFNEYINKEFVVSHNKLISDEDSVIDVYGDIEE
jgi:RecA/RadA recombinase